MRGSRNLCRGRAGPTARKQPGQRFFFVSFFFFFFFVQLILQFTAGVRWFYYTTAEKTILFQGSGGGPTFPRGVQLFPGGGGGGGSNANFYRNP